MAALSVHQTFHASRIEVSDIEATITANVDISEAVVVSRDDRLIAYCVRMREGGVSISPKSKPPLDKLLRPWLAERLPLYMIPAFFLELEKLPTTLNNKINRKALLDPAEAVRPDVVTAMPETEMERRIRSIWSNVLDLSTARIGVYDNFFHIGGNSLRVVRAQKQIEQLVKRPLSVARMYEHSTIQSLAAYLTTTLEAKPEPDSSRRRPKDTSNEEIAVISMACQLPGGVTASEEYWQLLDRGVHAKTDMPKDRWDADRLHNADPDVASKTYCRQGGFLASSIDDFDASFFGVLPREAHVMGPTHRIMLETCWEGVERAGFTMEQLRGGQTGVYLGTCNFGAHSSSIPLANL